MSRFSRTKTGKDLGSKQFFELIRSIGEAKSKQEEDKIIAKEIAVLKSKMGEKDIDKKQMKEYVVRLLYCEMLGHNAEFGYIHCVNLIASTELLEKRTGYLAVQLTISPENDLLYLVVSAIQKDLKSSNFLEVCCALNAATKLINTELMTCVIEDVRKCLDHEQAIVKKKAIVCIHAFWRKNEFGVGAPKQYHSVLCDKDPAVMACALNFLQDLSCLNPEENKHLVLSFVSILQQICEHRLKKEYDYHRIPAPWIQIKLLKLLAILCHQDPEKSREAYLVVEEAMKRAADSGINIGFAVIYECVKTITCLAPQKELLEEAAEAISKFLTSPNPNLKYLGITSLSRIVLIDPSYAAEHRKIVMGCLEDHDETIKRKTLDILYAMTNPDSVELIVARLIKFLGAAHDVYLKADLVSNVCELAFRFFPTMEWYIGTMNHVIKLGEQYVDSQIVQGMLKMIAEGSEELEEDENEQFRLYAVDSYYQLLDATEKLPETLIQIISWVLGEYGFMSQQYSKNDIIDKLCDLLEKTDDVDTRGYIITALMKLTAPLGSVPDTVCELVSAYKSSSSVALQQRCYEFLELAKHPALMVEALPLDGCCEDLEVDPELSFLDGVVRTALAGGAKDRRKRDEAFNMPEHRPVLKTKEVTAENIPTHTVPGAPVVEPELHLNVDEDRGVWSKKMLEKQENEPQLEAGGPEEEDEEEDPDQPVNNHSYGEPADDGQPTGKVKKKKTKDDKLADLLFNPGGKKKGEKAARKAEKERKRAEKEARRARGDEDSQPPTSVGTASPMRSDGDSFPMNSPPTSMRAAPSIAAQLVPVTQQEISLATFEGHWKANPHEGSGAVPLPGEGVTVDIVANRVMAISNIIKVQTIGTEFIAAARHQVGFVLAHFRLTPGQLSMKIRSPSAELTALVVAHIQTNLLGQ
ncbi:AP-4 complex subunit epsilon [Diplonema papillatum]|nr:AP-4 complex subunit epsilon [Diplonema papillatum]